MLMWSPNEQQRRRGRRERARWRPRERRAGRVEESRGEEGKGEEERNRARWRPGGLRPEGGGERRGVRQLVAQVTKLCGLGMDHSACSVEWAQDGTQLAVGTNLREV
ncbi:hypothetical protein AAC387_Pa01g2653 [Persea americana]